MLDHSCPIDHVTVDEHVVRLNAFFSILLLYHGTFTEPFLLLILIIDYYLRISNVKRSPVAQLSRFLLNLLHIHPKPVDRAPKRFASQLGLTFSLLALLFSLLDFAIAMTITYLLFLTALSLEAFFNYCVGCKVYTILSSIGLIKPSQPLA